VKINDLQLQVCSQKEIFKLRNMIFYMLCNYLEYSPWLYKSEKVNARWKNHYFACYPAKRNQIDIHLLSGKILQVAGIF